MGVCWRLRQLQQVTASVQMSTHQRRDSLMEENPVWERPVGPPTLETVAPVCNFTHAKDSYGVSLIPAL